MNDTDLETLWRSPGNQPSAFQIEAARQRFTTRLRRRYTGFVVYFTFVLAVLTVLTVWLAVRWTRTGIFRPATMLPALALLAVPWAAALLQVRRYLRHRHQHPDYSRSLPSALRAAMAENEAARDRAAGILRLHAMSVPLLALCLWQLHAQGLARMNEMLSMAVFFGTTIAVSTGWVGLHQLTRLRREAAGLREMMAASHPAAAAE